MKLTRKIGLVAGPVIGAAGILALVSSGAALAAGGPSSATTNVTGNVSEVVGWLTPPPATFSLGALTPGQLSATSDIPWAVQSNDGNGTQVELAIQNNGAEVTSGSISGPGPFTGANAAADNATYAADGGNVGLSNSLAITGVDYGWNIDGAQGSVPQTASITEYTVAANDTSTFNTAVAFYTPESVFPDTVSATFTYTLIGA